MTRRSMLKHAIRDDIIEDRKGPSKEARVQMHLMVTCEIVNPLSNKYVQKGNHILMRLTISQTVTADQGFRSQERIDITSHHQWTMNPREIRFRM